MFLRDESDHTRQTEAEVRNLPADPNLSSVCLFAEARLPEDQLAIKAAKDLNIGAVPAVSELFPDPLELKEVSRFEGVFTFAEMRDSIVTDTCKNHKFKSGKRLLDSKTAKALTCRRSAL